MGRQPWAPLATLQGAAIALQGDSNTCLNYATVYISPMRHVSEPQQIGGTARGQDARHRLVEAAARLFASRGYDGVGVREIAKAAEANVAAVSYHFGGKRELYLATLDRLMDEMRPIGGPVIERIDQAFEGGPPDRGELSALAAFVTRHILMTMLAGDLPAWAQQTVLREFQEPTADYRPMLDERVLPLHRAVRRIVAASLGLPLESDEAILAAHGVLGQIMVFAAARIVALEQLEWPDFEDERLEPVIAVTTRAVLGALGFNSEMEPRQCVS